ncbi:uncharacterized protein LOC125199963, partial [Salvia hispanica]|uniref:uncharacterized protein LOC125199963 n=1 Tax=Salvia hispanica TaxID=49212 RepID=UPI0020099BB3
MAKLEIDEGNSRNVSLRLIGKRCRDDRTYNLPSVSEVAALIVGDFDEALGDRDIIVESQNGELQRIPELHPSFLGLQYPILFPYGEDGYREDIDFAISNNSGLNSRKKISPREYFSFRLQQREDEPPTILHARRLFQQFVVDAYTMIEAGRLRFVRTHQKQLCAEMYKGLNDAILRGETDPSTQGKRVILPSSFVGGARYMIQNYQDAMALCGWFGYPTLFITFTSNPKWPEIVRFVDSRGLKYTDRPDIVCRIFKVKLDELIRDIRKNKIFGNVQAVIYTVEFQKRGLPHAHILFFLSKEDKQIVVEQIDKFISFEIPAVEIDPFYHANVAELMVHGPCGVSRPSSPCMVKGRCGKYFPKRFVDATTFDGDGYPIYRRRDDGRVVLKNDIPLDNRYVVPHNRYLLMKYGGHINVEWCNQSRSIKYLFKYINKGLDRVTATFMESGMDSSENNIDEVKMYYDCRYVSSSEAVWRIFGFDMQYKDPPVERLGFHFENEQSVIFSESEPLDIILDRRTAHQSKFLGWMEANKIYPQGRDLTYSEFPTRFVWKGNCWQPRKQRFAIGRMFYIAPGSGEMYYLRCLLNIVRGATSYEEIRCVNGIQYDTFREACFALGLLDDDKEYVDGITEANLVLNDDEIKNLALVEIDRLLVKVGRSLRDFDDIPYPSSENYQLSVDGLINEELCYDHASLSKDLLNFISKFTDEQRHVYDVIMTSINSDIGGMFFVYGYGGTGKTFIWRSLSAAIRSKGEIFLNVASSVIASLLLPGGRTAHSRFKIPINPNEDSDEAPMIHKYCIEALDKSLRDIMRSDIHS